MRAIEALEKAINYVGDGDANKSGYVCQYSQALVSRFERTGFMTDLAKAIDILKATLDRSPNDPNRAMLLTQLSQGLYVLFDRTWSADDLDKAIDAINAAVEATPKYQGVRGERLVMLGNSLRRRFRLNQWTLSLNDLTGSVAAYEEAGFLESAPLRTRIFGAWNAAKLLEVRNPDRASWLASLAVELLPNTNSVSWDRGLQQRTLSEYAGLVVTAAALALTAGDGAYEALRLVELGRGVISSLQLDLRTDFTSLRIQPEFAQKQFQQVQARLATLSLDQKKPHSSNTSKMPERLPRGMRFLRDGMALLDPVISEMMMQAKLGPIVIFNVSHTRSDVLIITTERGVRSLLLPGLQHRVLQDKVVELKDALTSLNPLTYNKTKGMMKKVLAWLWDVAVGPILDQLGFREPMNPTNFHHVWWISSGLLNLLPIHAAGYHGQGSTRNVLDRVVSSYAPTIKCLAYSRHQAAHMSFLERDDRKQNTLLVGMSTTPNQTSLPNVDEEIRSLNSLLRNTVTLQMPHTAPTKSEVLLELGRCQIAHFACHGESTISDPSQSRLLLSDWQNDPLTVADIISLKLNNPQLAFLSACHSADNRVFGLLDEGIHLMGAFQLAGFPFVLGTLWQIDDEHSVQVAKDVYSDMMRNQKIIDVTWSAPALHNAVEKLRDRTRLGNGGEDDPLVWATYIHMGA